MWSEQQFIYWSTKKKTFWEIQYCLNVLSHPSFLHILLPSIIVCAVSLKKFKDSGQVEYKKTRCNASSSIRSLIRNGLDVRMAVKKPFLRKGNREKRLRYAKLYRGDWSDRMMNPNLKHLVQIFVTTNKREVQQWLSTAICKTWCI